MNLGVIGNRRYSGGDKVIANSVETSPGYFTRTPSSAGDRKKWTFSTWFKLTTLSVNSTVFSSGSTDPNRAVFYIQGSDGRFVVSVRVGSVWKYITFSTNTFTTSIWYNTVLRYDAANATQADRVEVDINGVAETLDVQVAMPQNQESTFNSTIVHAIGENLQSSSPLNGLFAEPRFISGQLLPATTFGEFDGADWVPIEYTDPSSTNGFMLDFEDNSTATALGTDVSVNGNDWTPVGILTTDQSTDTPG